MKDKSGNPALSESALDRLSAKESTSKATIGGTAIKTFILFVVTVIGATFGWNAMASASSSVGLILIVSSLLAFVFALITIFKPALAMFTGPLYALSQGYVLGAISQTFNASYNGIVVQAIGLTGAIFFVSLWAFSLGLIKVTNKMKVGIIIATLGIFMYYLVAFVLGLFGITAPLIIDSGPWGILFSVVVVIIATLNLFLDYDMIQNLVNRGAPKQMEWYGAFALIVTLIWLYMEVLRLLSKVRS